MASMTTTKPRIYVACLAAYSNGKLHGDWVDATQHEEDMWIDIEKILQSSPVPDAEEWAIHDSEGFGSVLGENESLETVAKLGQAIEEHGEALVKFIECERLESDDDIEEMFCDRFRGEYDTEEDFAEEFYNEIHEIPDFLQSHIDWESVARDLFIDDFYSLDSGSGVYVFSRF